MSSGLLVGAARAQNATALPSDPFTLGVASGDPSPDGMVLWTRLAPLPLQPDGGMPVRPVDVQWQVASDEAFTKVLRAGTVRTTPARAHSVHVEVTGLAADRWYFYRFQAAGFGTPAARTRTMPARGARKDRLRLGVVGCQQYEAGFYSGYANMAREDLDLVLHTGDYIYEGGARATSGLPFPDGVAVRDVVGGEIRTLADYRVRHAQYKTDPDLQAAHRAFPFIVTTDDHEVENNYADETSEETEKPSAGFLSRRAAAYQAYYEHMPLRAAVRPKGPDLALFRGLEFGLLARINVLDTRQYRSNQPCGDGLGDCAERLAPTQTLMGKRQEAWLHDRLRRSPATWNVISQQVVMASFDYNGAPGQTPALYNLDSWDGYAVERARLMGVMAEDRVQNPVVLTGDVHSSWANDLRTTFFDPTAAVVGSEFVGTSMTSVGIPTAVVGQALADNPHVKFYNGELHGYLSCTVTPEGWTSDYQSVAARSRDEVAFTAVSFVTAAGKPGVELASVGGVPAMTERQGDTGTPSSQRAANLAVSGTVVLGDAVLGRRWLQDDGALLRNQAATPVL